MRWLRVMGAMLLVIAVGAGSGKDGPHFDAVVHGTGRRFIRA